MRIATDFQLVIVEPILIVPESCAAEAIHGIRDCDKVFKKLGSYVLICRIITREFQRNRQHCRAIKSHPCRAVCLLQITSCRQRLRAVKNTDIVQPQKPTGKQVPTIHILAIDPPCEIDQQLLKGTHQKAPVTLPSMAGHFVHTPTRPRMNGRIDIRKCKLIRRHLPVRMHVPFTQHQQQL